MENPKGYFDYCIGAQCLLEGDFSVLIKKLVDYGYRTIAVNQTVQEPFAREPQDPSQKKQPGFKKDVVVPPPFDLKQYENENLKILNRLTVVFSTNAFVQQIHKSPNFKKYNIVAAMPQSEEALKLICHVIHYDLLTFDPNNKFKVRLQRKTYNLLLERGYHFELLYGPILKSNPLRKVTFSTSHEYYSAGKSKRLLISSGAIHESLIRSPYDVINLGFLFGLSESQSKDAVLSCGKTVYNHAIARQHRRAIMFVETVNEKVVSKKAAKRMRNCGNEAVEDEPPAKQAYLSTL